jgi:hypothetical protein
MKADYLGHKPHDPSGQRANLFEQLFKTDAILFHKFQGGKTLDPAALREQMRKMA